MLSNWCHCYPKDENNCISNPFTLGGLFGGTKETNRAVAKAKKQSAKKKEDAPKKKGWFGR